MNLEIGTTKELIHTVKLNSSQIVDLIIQQIYKQLNYPENTKAEISILVEAVPTSKGKKQGMIELPSIIISIHNPELNRAITEEERLEEFKKLEDKHA